MEVDENTKLINYEGGAMFVRHCPKCGRFLKADKSIRINGLDDWIREPNATCSKCGRVEMDFLGWFD